MQIKLSDHFSYLKLFRFCFPSVMMMLFISVYGVVDGFFISNFIGKTSLAAVNLVMPVNFIIGGFGFMVGTGGSALVAKTLGEAKKDKANKYFTMMVYFVLLFGSIISLITAALIKPISIFLGADKEMLKDCIIYGTVINLFNPAFMLQNIFQNFLITAEKPKLGLKVTVAAGITNMVLDALFIAVFKFGVAGAAFATGISQCVGFIIPMIYFAGENKSLLKFVKTEFNWRAIGYACFNGSSELLSSISGSVISIVYNFQLLRIAGQNGVAAYGVLMYINFVFIASFIGYNIGVAPVISYHYGAKNRCEMKNLLRKSIHITLSLGIFMFLFSEMISLPIAKIFVGYDEMLFKMTVHALRIFAFSFILVGFNIFSSSFFTALNDGLTSAVISFLRTLIFQLIPIAILPVIWGLNGIWVSDTVSEIGAFLVSVIFIIFKHKKYGYY